MLWYLASGDLDLAQEIEIGLSGVPSSAWISYWYQLVSGWDKVYWIGLKGIGLKSVKRVTIRREFGRGGVKINIVRQENLWESHGCSSLIKVLVVHVWGPEFSLQNRQNISTKAEDGKRRGNATWEVSWPLAKLVSGNVSLAKTQTKSCCQISSWH